MATLRVVSYAINGRGLGHLTRQLAILRQVKQICALLDLRVETWVITSSEADTLARREGIPALKMPSKAMLRDAGIEPTRYLAIARGWVLNCVSGLAPDLLLVDTFPAGSFGELVSVLEIVKRRVLVARRVRDEFKADPAYSALLPLFQDVITPDDGGTGPILLRSRHELTARDAARAALGIPQGARSVYGSVGGGGDKAAPSTLPRMVRGLTGTGWHVVVGAGPLYSGPELRGAGITWLSRYAPVELFAGLDAAVSAAGYNSFHELMHAGVPAVFLPQPRIADDQTERAERAQSAGAGLVAPSVEAVPELLEQLWERREAASAAAAALVPENGALAAALQALEGLVPAEDLATAASVLTPEVARLIAPLAAAGAGSDGARPAMRLLRLLAGSDDTVALLGRFVAACTGSGVPTDTALLLTEALVRKFPASHGLELVESTERLLAAWARFDDWMGAVSLMRAVPVQRRLTLGGFSERLSTWLSLEDDLFDATRAFTRLEGAGRMQVDEVLTMLAAGA